VAGIPQSLLKKLGTEWSSFMRRYKHTDGLEIRNMLIRIGAAGLAPFTGAWLSVRAGKGSNGELVIALGGKVMRSA
jgi:hypothetical protein